MAGGVGDDELSSRRGEIPVGHIDRDPLLALGAEPVCQVGEVDLASSGEVRRAFERLDLVVHQGLGIVKQPADERGLAVVHRPAGVEPEEIDRMVKGNGH